MKVYQIATVWSDPKIGNLWPIQEAWILFILRLMYKLESGEVVNI